MLLFLNFLLPGLLNLYKAGRRILVGLVDIRCKSSIPKDGVEGYEVYRFEGKQMTSYRTFDVRWERRWRE